MEQPKAATLLDYLTARRDYNGYASQLPEAGREQYAGAEQELQRLITLFGGQDYANHLIRNPAILSAYADTLQQIEHLKEILGK